LETTLCITQDVGVSFKVYKRMVNFLFHEIGFIRYPLSSDGAKKITGKVFSLQFAGIMQKSFLYNCHIYVFCNLFITEIMPSAQK